MVTYTAAIDRNDDGDFVDVGEAVTADVLELWWRLGMERAYDSMASPSRARVTLRNRGRTYSPELNTLKPGHSLRIQSDDGTTTRTHFTGFISHITLSTGENSDRLAVIHARGLDRDLSESRATLPLMQSVAADAVIDTALNQVQARRAVLAGGIVIGVDGHNTIGTHTLFGKSFTCSLETGKSTFAYIGDSQEEAAVSEIVQQAAQSERGRFFINREGVATFYNRHHTLTDTAITATFSDDMEGLVYTYGAEIANQVDVRMRPRRVGNEGAVLWSLVSVQRLPAGESRQLSLNYRDEDNQPVGAVDVLAPVAGYDFTATVAADGSGIDLTPYITVNLLEAGGRAARLEVRNTGSSTAYLQKLQLRGTPLISGDPLTLSHADAESVTFYGARRIVIDLPALTSLDEADQIARYELAQRKSPTGSVSELRTSMRSHLASTLARTLFDRIRIIESQTGHDAAYFIISEEHHVDLGGTRHRVRWRLESSGDNTFVIVGSTLLDASRMLAY